MSSYGICRDVQVLVSVAVDIGAHGARHGAGYYVCAASGGQPLVCGPSIAVNAFLQTPGVPEVVKAATRSNCRVVVEYGQRISRILLVRGAETARDVEEAIDDAERAYQKFDTAEGVRFLMRYLSPR